MFLSGHPRCCLCLHLLFQKFLGIDARCFFLDSRTRKEFSLDHFIYFFCIDGTAAVFEGCENIFAQNKAERGELDGFDAEIVAVPGTLCIVIPVTEMFQNMS